MRASLDRVFRKFLHIFISFAPGIKFRRNILRFLGAKVCDNVYIGQGLIVTNKPDGLIDELVVEDQVAISPRVTLVLNIDPGPSPLQTVYRKGQNVIHIKRGAWIGAGAIILSPINIGEYSIVAAGSVVTENVPPYTLVGGVPARKIKDISLSDRL